jgi:hypothetical protein
MSSRTPAVVDQLEGQLFRARVVPRVVILVNNRNTHVETGIARRFFAQARPCRGGAEDLDHTGAEGARKSHLRAERVRGGDAPLSIGGPGQGGLSSSRAIPWIESLPRATW